MTGKKRSGVIEINSSSSDDSGSSCSSEEDSSESSEELSEVSHNEIKVNINYFIIISITFVLNLFTFTLFL